VGIEQLTDIELQRVREGDQRRQQNAEEPKEQHIAPARTHQREIVAGAPSGEPRCKNEGEDDRQVAQDQDRRCSRIAIAEEKLIVGEALVPPHQSQAGHD